MAALDPLDRLELERERALFMFYGYAMADGRPGGEYSKHAHSLSEAVDDLAANPGVADEGGFFVRDAFLENGDDGPVLHVELISVAEILSGESEEGT